MIGYTTTTSNANLERIILTGMIVSDRTLRVLSLIYKPEYFIDNVSREIARWCLIHQTKYNCAPKGSIQTLFEAYKRNGLEPDMVQLIARLLASLSDEFERIEQFNEELCIDTAMVYFKERSLTILKSDLEYHLEGGNINLASAAVAQFISAPESIVGFGSEPLLDMNGTKEAFDDRTSLFELPGDLGKLIGPFEREWVVMVVGKYKGYKSYTCQFIAQQAYFSGLNVAWFDFELGERRLRRRFAQAMCAMPLKQPKHDKLLVPIWDCSTNQTGECSRAERINYIKLVNDEGDKPKWDNAPYGYKACTACNEWKLNTWLEERPYEVLDWRMAWQKFKMISGSVMGARLKMQCWPKFSAGVNDIESTLQIWQHLDGFIPDVIIVDQPDIMKMDGRGDTRHKIDELWKQLSSIPQRLHCLLIAPTQAGGKDAQERRRLRVSDVAEDSRKLGHVDMSIKIDQDEDDKEAQRAIYSIGVGRDDEVVSDKVMVLQCLTLGQAVIDSKFF